ncbi:WD40 repeat domain-containing protein [Chitinophaga sp. CF418]|uniref:WD40 repeat domain-containing protein n=1 Tax=Chitinophaga sp. CF418 TaxID=1855287 RepID=UPI000922781B|nr:WD40 repeat domain-containing protein [Chitinophaga sp. CF418]SHN32784.1 WD domain, G-beta repeat [Chitinophaga sp. CF418]
MELTFKNKEAVLSMAVSPDGKWLAVGKIVDADRNPSLTIWDTNTWECVAEEEAGNVSSIVSLSFNRHSSTLAYLTAEDHIRFFDLKDMYLTREMAWDKPYKVRYGAHEDLLMVTGRDLSILDKDDIEVFNYSDYKGYEHTEGLSPELFRDYYGMSDQLEKVSYGNKPVVAAFLQEDSAVIITGNNEDKFSVYDIKSGKRKEQYPGGIIQAGYMETDKAEKYLLVIGLLPYADLMWELPEMKRVLSENMNEEFPGSSAFRFHPSSRLFAFGGSGGKVFLRSIETGEFLMEKDIHKREVRALGFSADGKMLISGSADGRVVLTDITEYLT